VNASYTVKIIAISGQKMFVTESYQMDKRYDD